VDRVHRLISKYGEKVRFVCVYVMEAHAKDQWPIGNTSCIAQHKTLDERILAARKFQEEFHYQPELYVDTMDNLFNNEYCVWPERGFVISMKEKKEGEEGGGGGRVHERKVEYLSDPQLDGSMNWELGISQWLAKYFGF